MWRKSIQNSRRKNIIICDFLKEQKYFSGIGNYLLSEILYGAEIKPDRKLQDLSDKEIETLLKISVQKIKESHQHGGLTIRSYWDLYGNRGTFPIKVYRKTVDPLGNKVIADNKIAKDKRTVHWVPQIQH